MDQARPHGHRRSSPTRLSRTVALAAALLVVTAGAAVVGSPSEAAVGSLVAAAAPSPAPVTTSWRGINPVTQLTADTFSAPPATDRPWVRWNWVPATTTIADLEKDLDDLAAAGIAGVEIGQGGNPTNEQLTAILQKANRLGITVGIKYSGGAPTTWNSTDNYTRKTLTNSRVFVDAGANYNATVPGTGTILAVEAYRCTASPCPTTGVREVDRASVINLTSTLTGTNPDGFFGGTTAGTLNWTAPTAPAGAQWVVVTFRQTVFQNAPEVLSKQGTDAMIAGYEALWTPEIKELVAQNRSDIFVDSHPNDPWGNATELWSSNMASAFQTQAGYSITPDLAALFYADFAYSDKSDQRVRTDFYQVRNDLFINNRIKPFTAWANTHDMTLRLQPEDPNIGGADVPFQDQIDMAYNLQRPEHESLVGDQVDVWRPIASANHWNGNPWYSEECCADRGQNYVETLQDVEARMNKSLAAGITKNVYHVYPTDHSPTSTFPGYANFGPTSFSGAWGPRNPNWASNGKTVNDWMSRNQQVLTQGQADMDVAVYLHSFEWQSGSTTNTDGSPWTGKIWDDPSMERAGYTYDYVNPTLLKTPMAKVRGKQLAPDGPSYKALVVDSKINPATHPLKTAMPVAVAQRMLEFAQDGLPIIVVGDAPSTTPGAKGDDVELRSIIADLLAQPTVYRVASEAGVPTKLAALGLSPDAKPAERSSLFSLHRNDAAANTDYYYFYNQGVDRLGWFPDSVYEEPDACRYTGTAVNPCQATGARVDQLVTLKGTGTPYLMDADSGKITPIAHYTTGAGTVTVRVSLEREASAIIALAGPGNRLNAAVPAQHVVSTTADSATFVAGKLVLRDTQPGTYTALLSDGTTASATITDAPAAIDLTGATWQLAAEDWKPTNPVGTTGAAGSAISKSPVALTLDGLASWPDIPALAKSSGVGTYTTTVQMPSSWNASSSAVLSLGQVVDTVELSVNGTFVPIGQIDPTVDVGPYLVPGANSISVRVSTTLNNLLAGLLPAVATRGVIQEYGLVGPVTLTPAGQATATSASGSTGPTTGAPAAAKTGSTIRAKVRPTRSASSQRAKIKVTVSATGTTPTGAVIVTKGSKIIGRGSLSANGSTTIRISKQAAGKKKLVVTYTGSATVAASATKVVLRVTRK